MNYTSKFAWVSSDGVLKMGLKWNGIVVCHPNQELVGDLASQIYELENVTVIIPQMKEAETKATKFTKKK